MNNLQKVFHKFSENNKDVLVLLDETYCFSRNSHTNKKRISITSLMDEEDVYECLKEEGSAIINYKMMAKGLDNNINRTVNSFVLSLLEFNFEPFIVTLLNNEVIISIVISDTDVGFECNYDDGEEEGVEEDEDEVEDDEDEVEDDEEVGDEEDDEEDEVGDEEDDDKKVEDNNEDEEEDDEEDKKIEDNNEDDEDEEDKKVEDDNEDDEEDDNEDNNEEDEEVQNSSILKEIRSEIHDINKIKKPELIDYLNRLNVKNINGKYIRKCQKHELCEHLKTFLEN